MKTFRTLGMYFLVFVVGVVFATQKVKAEPFIIIHEEFWTLTQASDAHCLAMNIYHEGRSDNLAGQYAVADVVLNRVDSKRYPNTVCEVVYQARMKPSWKDPDKLIPIKNKCQFSWYCDGKDDYPHETEAWAQAQYIAYSMLNEDHFRGITEGATHYHTTYVAPAWNKHFYSVGRIGAHVFFRAD